MINPILENARKDLLDLTARNRLVHTPRERSRSSRLDIVDELTEEIFRILVTEGKQMSFLSKPKKNEDDSNTNQDTNSSIPSNLPNDIELNESSNADDAAGNSAPEKPVDESQSIFEVEDIDAITFAQPDEEVIDGVAKRHRDDKLQTNLISEKLQKKLLRLYYDARTSEDEQGINTLYLACGFLKWYENEKSDLPRQAPLILIPINLERKSANARFKVKYSDEEITTNLSIQAKIKSEFGIELPDIGDLEEFNPTDYFAAVQKVIADKKRWEIVPDGMVVWFFSFAKFLMYKDLEEESWPDERKLSSNSLIGSLLQDGFDHEPSPYEDDENIDQHLPPNRLTHVVDADSSQTLAIDEARLGKNLVIQGPPGTGKSQTITNLIASAIIEGKKVLFVAEKMAALDVVKSRMDQIGLGDACIELHSNKANKKSFLLELEKTLNLGKPSSDGIAENTENLRQARDLLNLHVRDLHEPIEESNLSAYQVIGQLVRLSKMNLTPLEFALNQASKWTSQDFRTRRGVVNDLCSHLTAIGNPSTHIWKGVCTEVLLPSEQTAIQTAIKTSLPKLEQLRRSTDELGSQYGLPSGTFRDAVYLSNSLRQILRMPVGADPEKLNSKVWNSNLESIEELVQNGQSLREQIAALNDQFTETAWDTDLTQTRRNLKALGKSFFRFFSTKFRNAKRELDGLLKNNLPTKVDDQVELVDRLILVQNRRKRLRDASDIGKLAFGDNWLGEDTNWKLLSEIVEWKKQAKKDGLPDSLYDVISKTNSLDEFRKKVKSHRATLQSALESTKAVIKTLKYDCKLGLGSSSENDAPLSGLSERFGSWVGQSEELSRWIDYNGRVQQLEKLDLQSLANLINDGSVTHKELNEQFELKYYEALLKHVYTHSEHLRGFSGQSHSQIVEQFRNLDKQRQLLSRQEVAYAHFQSVPQHSAGSGELGLIYCELNKKRGHLPIRKLLGKAGHAVQAIKPVFMMSPISLAQFLEPGVLEFDLLLIDEASQVKPVDALGAMARCKQVVVVGDSKQLPPTSFFDIITSGKDDDQDENFDTNDVESILGLCAAQNIKQRMLRWHYRSRHQSLIAVSNHEFYDDRLFIIPSPLESNSNFGLSFVHTPNGVFDRGKSRTNRIEAKAVAEAVFKHIIQNPKQSLGIGTFSVSQRDAILDEIELLQREHPELDEFFMPGGNEPFFVKNLENIQGDERDVIFISIGYGRDKNNFMSMSFGPLNRDGGERRLNVLISRAKQKCVVFSSITADDIDLKKSSAKGVKALKTFLSYAKSGIIDVGIETDKDFDSEFERQVANSIADLGYEVRAQIGVAGFFVDLAIVDPDQPGRYLLGIECDGASYHSSRSARDRDRLRQAVLEDRGWIIHRIWSTDWFRRPDEQIKKVIEAINEAKIHLAATDREVEVAAEDFENEWKLKREKREEIELQSPASIEVEEYVEADINIKTHQELHELSPDQLGKILARIVEIEGPVHISELARRTAFHFGLNRTGRRIVDSVGAAVDQLINNSRIDRNGEFVSLRGMKRTAIRTREHVLSPNLKKPEYLPPSELQMALEAIVQVNIGIEHEDAFREASRLFGYKSLSQKLKDRMHQEVDSLLDKQVLEVRNNKLYCKSDNSVKMEVDLA